MSTILPWKRGSTYSAKNWLTIIVRDLGLWVLEKPINPKMCMHLKTFFLRSQRVSYYALWVTTVQGRPLSSTY